MSFKSAGLVWELDLPFNKAWVLMAMADHADHADHQGRNIFPSMPLVAWKTNYSLRQVQRIVADLRDDGILIPYDVTPGGVKVYEMKTDHVARKEMFVEPPPGRPQGSVESVPRKMGCQIVTPFYVTHNHQLLAHSSKNSEVVVTNVSNSTNSNYSQPQNVSNMTTHFLTLDVLTGFDPGAPSGFPRRRFRCPESGCSGKEGRSLDVDLVAGCYICHRCGAKGRLGGETSYQPPAPPQNLKPKRPWGEVLAKSGIGPIAGSPGAAYLERRGISAQLATECGVRFARSLYNRAAVLFDIRDRPGAVVAVQGRHIDRAEPRMHTMGPNKQGVFATPGALDGDFAICEAPLDAISLYAMGMPAVAVCGTGLTAWLPSLAKGRRVYVASDADQQGDADFEVWGAVLRASGACVERMRPTCGKDWNDVLRSGGNLS